MPDVSCFSVLLKEKKAFLWEKTKQKHKRFLKEAASVLSIQEVTGDPSFSVYVFHERQSIKVELIVDFLNSMQITSI